MDDRRCELFQINSFSKPVQRVSIHTCWVRNILQLRNGVPQIMFDFQANMQNRIFNTTNILSLVSSISLKLMKNSLNLSVQISMKIHSSVVSPVSITDLLQKITAYVRYYEKKGTKVQKKGTIIFFSPNFSEFRAFGMLHHLKGWCFCKFQQRIRYFISP